MTATRPPVRKLAAMSANSADGSAEPFKIELASRVMRLPPYLFGRINQALYLKRRAGDDVIDMGMGNPTDPPADSVIEKLAEAARNPDNHGYSKSNGIANLRRELASKYWHRYGVRIDPEREAIVCLGSKEGFSHMCLALMGPGDTAITPAPYFPVHMYGVALASGNVIALEVRDSETFLKNIAYTDVASDGYRPPSFLAAKGRSMSATNCERHAVSEAAGLLCAGQVDSYNLAKRGSRPVRRSAADEVSEAASSGIRWQATTNPH